MKTVYFAPIQSEKRLRNLTDRISSARPGEILLLDRDDWNAVRQIVAIQMPDAKESDSDGGECD